MGHFAGGMEFPLGQPLRLPSPPQQLPAHPITIRTPDRPEVISGQTVKRGQYLIEPILPSEACYVSPVGGSVRHVTPQPDGGYELTIDPGGEQMPTSLEVGPPRGRKLENWFAALRLVGPWSERDGGVGLIKQLDAARNHEVDTLICVGVDDLSLYADRSSLLMSFPDDAVMGTLIIADLLNVKQVVMQAGRVPAMLGRLRASCRKYRLRLSVTGNRYPAAHPTMAFYAARAGSRRSPAMPSGHNPVERGVMMITPWTAIRIGRWFTLRRFDLVRPIFIASASQSRRLEHVYAMPGQPIATMHKSLASAEHGAQTVLSGNPMTGTPLQKPRVCPIDDLMLSILPTMQRAEPEPCINCGWCMDVCPTRLDPVRMLNAATTRRDDAWLCDQLPWCIQCGLCTYACPSALPLAETFRRIETEMAGPDDNTPLDPTAHDETAAPDEDAAVDASAPREEHPS